MSASLMLLQRLTRNALGLRQGGYMLVQDGEGFSAVPETLRLDTGANARIVRIKAELELRHALWRHGKAPLIALVPSGLKLPADLLQCADRQRVHTLTGDEVLSALLNTRVTGVDSDELRTLAIKHADQIQNRLSASTTPTVIDRPMLERTLVEVVAEMEDLREADGDLSVLFARWLRDPPKWPRVLRELAVSTLVRHHSDAGRVLAWVLEEVEPRATQLFVYGALLSVSGEVPQSAWGPLWELRDPKTSPPRLRAPSAARPFISELVTKTARRLEHDALRLLRDADVLAQQHLTLATRQTSPLLPLAFEDRAKGIATRLSKGQPAAPEAQAFLRSHVLAEVESRRLELFATLSRLVQYHRHQGALPTSASAFAQDYLRDHAHADFCARRAERLMASTAAHRDEARLLLDKIYDYRDKVNQAYAGQLTTSYEQTLYSHEVVALQNLTRDVIAARITEAGEKVFLLVLDGCSVPVFLDLLDQLTAPEFKIGLASEDMSLRLTPGLSPLPTITSHARGALFLGAIPRDPFVAETVWREDGERKTDPARFKQNPSLNGITRELFLKGDLTDGGQRLSEALRSETALVAAVFNAVDDRIGSHDTGAAWRLQVEDITGLVPALNAALSAGRSVLLTADHGHSPFRSKALRVGSGSTPRYASLEATEPVPDGFIEIDCGELAGDPGRTAYAWKSGVYRGQIQVGFHGGCSLEEMVVPVAWLARHGLPAERPVWWDHHGVVPPGRKSTKRRPVPRSSPMATPLSLPFSPRPAPTPTQPAAVPADSGNATGTPATTQPAAVDNDGPPGWAQQLSDEMTQRIFIHIVEHGVITEAEVTQMLGGAKQFRKFNRRFEDNAARVPFRTRIEQTAAGKRYVFVRG